LNLGGERLDRIWNAFWFSPGSAIDLAAARILVSATAIWVLLSRDLPALSGVPQAFWSTVRASFQWRYLLFPGHESLERWLQGLALLALVATCFGIFPRIGALVAAVLLVHLTPLELFQSVGAFTWSIPILGLFFVSASPCGDALSLRPELRISPLGWEYHWPVQAIRVQLCLLYFFSAYSKMWHAGLSWAAPAHMQAWVLGCSQREHPVFGSFAPWVAQHLWVCGAMGILALAVEFTFPLALISRRARLVLVPVALAMHVGIVLVLNITVFYWPVLLVFLDWQSLAARWGAIRTQRRIA
jgi:hypothetical protein